MTCTRSTKRRTDKRRCPTKTVDHKTEEKSWLPLILSNPQPSTPEAKQCAVIVNWICER